MSDSLWVNIRYALIAAGVGVAVKYSGGIFDEESATAIVTPIVGAVVAIATWAWGNYVRKGTVAVPAATARRTDVPTVSAATGQIEPATTDRYEKPS